MQAVESSTCPCRPLVGLHAIDEQGPNLMHQPGVGDATQLLHAFQQLGKLQGLEATR